MLDRFLVYFSGFFLGDFLKGFGYEEFLEFWEFWIICEGILF
jgi:hypothetical protein